MGHLKVVVMVVVLCYHTVYYVQCCESWGLVISILSCCDEFLFVIVITVNIVIDAYPSKVSGCFLRIHFYCKVSGLILHYRFCICTVKYYITKNIAPLMWPVLTANK